MRKKFAAQIRTGVVAAISDVRWTVANGYPPPTRFVAQTELEKKAYDRTQAREVAKEVLRTWGRIEQKLKDHGWLDDDVSEEEEDGEAIVDRLLKDLERLK